MQIGFHFHSRMIKCPGLCKGIGVAQDSWAENRILGCAWTVSLRKYLVDLIHYNYNYNKTSFGQLGWGGSVLPKEGRINDLSLHDHTDIEVSNTFFLCTWF